MSNSIARTPKPPYFAVIFTSLRTEGDQGYGEMADRMLELAAQQPGYLGVESARTPGGLGITVSYWSSEEAIGQWRSHAEHRMAQETGRRVWYSDFHLRVARVERSHGMVGSFPSPVPSSQQGGHSAYKGVAGSQFP